MTITRQSIRPATRILAGAIVATALCAGAALANQDKSTKTRTQATLSLIHI